MAKTKEITRSQVTVSVSSEVLEQEREVSGVTFYKKVRKMRKHPTVALARELVIAPLLASEWSIESKDNAPPNSKEFIDSVMQPLRLSLLKSSLFGCIDYGWQAYEKIFKLDETQRLITVQKIKPLLQDLSEIVIDKSTGAFAGIRQEGPPEITLPLEDSLLVNIDVEGTNWYGQSKMANVESAYDNWITCNDAATRYDKKLAGAHWVITYPVGKTRYNGVDDVDNAEIANDIAKRLQSSGTVILPKKVQEFVNNANDSAQSNAWEIELKSAYPTSNVAFIDRLKYCDALMSRALGMPERASMEGQFGTKAEAEAHADFAITNMELRHLIIVQHYNWHLVNQLLRFNWGEQYENSVYIKPAPVTDLKMNYLREIYKTFLSNVEGFAQERDNIDMQAMRDQLGIPSLSLQGKEEQDIKDAKQTLLSFMDEFRFAKE